MGVTNPVNFNQRGGGWIKMCGPWETSVYIRAWIENLGCHEARKQLIVLFLSALLELFHHTLNHYLTDWTTTLSHRFTMGFVEATATPLWWQQCLPFITLTWPLKLPHSVFWPLVVNSGIAAKHPALQSLHSPASWMHFRPTSTSRLFLFLPLANAFKLRPCHVEWLTCL